MGDRNWYVYLLVNTKNNSTYLGVTNDTKKRLKRHNGELKGGAKYTKAKKGSGKWKYNLIAGGFTKSEALSIERTAKNKRKKAKGRTPLARRLNVLLPLLNSRIKKLDEQDKRKKKKKRRRKREWDSDDNEDEKPKRKRRKKTTKKKKKKKTKMKPPIYFYRKLIKSREKFFKEHGIKKMEDYGSDSTSGEMLKAMFGSFVKENEKETYEYMSENDLPSFHDTLCNPGIDAEELLNTQGL
jgi:predicted GIY-YIG superfamily endonuclease